MPRSKRQEHRTSSGCAPFWVVTKTPWVAHAVHVSEWVPQCSISCLGRRYTATSVWSNLITDQITTLKCIGAGLDTSLLMFIYLPQSHCGSCFLKIFQFAENFGLSVLRIARSLDLARQSCNQTRSSLIVAWSALTTHWCAPLLHVMTSASAISVAARSAGVTTVRRKTFHRATIRRGKFKFLSDEKCTRWKRVGGKVQSLKRRIRWKRHSVNCRAVKNLSTNGRITAHSLKATNDSVRYFSFFFVLFCVCISSMPNSKPWQTFVFP